MRTYRRVEKPADLFLQGELAAQMLNERRDLRSLFRIVRDLRAYGDTVKESWELSKQWKSSALVQLESELDFDKAFSRYDSRPACFAEPYRESAIAVDQKFLKKGLPFIERQVFAIVLRLLEHDEFDRLKLCPNMNCGKWFFAGKKKTKRFCSEECRQGNFENTEHRREYNRKKQKRYYAAHYKPANPRIHVVRKEHSK